MTDHNEEDTFTAQGRDTPVPVGDRGGRAGPTRPSASDCPAQSVGNQAGALSRATGTKGGITDKKRLRLMIEGMLEGTRSAPVSPNSGTFDWTWDEEEGRTVKKPKGKESARSWDEPMIPRQVGAAALAARIRRLIVELGKEVRVVAEAAKERNTKKEVKEAAVKMGSLMSQLQTTEAQELLQRLGMRTEVKMRARDEVSGNDYSRDKEDKATEVKPTTSNAECQTTVTLDREEGNNDRIKALQAENGELKKELRRLKGEEETVTGEMLEGQCSYDRFENLERMRWPKEVFKAAFMARGSLLRGSKETDLMVLEEEERWQKINQGHRKALYDRFPELHDLEGRLTALTVRTRVMERGATGNERERWVMKAEVDENKRDWFNTLTQLRKMMIEGGRNKISIYPPGRDRGGETTRKMMEFIFRDSGIKCIIFINEGNIEGLGDTRLNEDKRRPQNNRRRKTNALIVSQSGESYVETLKKIKDTVKPGTLEAKSIKKIRKSRDGKTVIVVDNSDLAAVNNLVDNLRDAEGPNLEVNVSKDRDMTNLILRDLDGLTTKEEVGEALVKELGGEPGEYIVGELRPHFGGNQAVTVRVQRGKATTLMRNGTLRIGLSLCTVKERLEVPQCYKCYRYGHMRSECRETEDFSRACRKCGEAGHLARECDKERFCLNCKKPGHGAGSGQCPEFRKALSRVRANEKAKRRY